jgi:3-hydroxybutyryl-CoA dehydrogenase
LFKQLSSIVSDTCILASNTSSLSISSLASSIINPERFIGIHFFNPAHLMKLVEVIPAVQTSEQTLEISKNLLLSCKKLVVVAKDTPGFIVNRIARPYYGEAIKIYEEGIAKLVDIDWAMTEVGFKMGPFALMDFIGHDINYHVTEIVYNAFYQDPRYRPSFAQKRLVEAGYLGIKTGRGFYLHSENAIKENPTINSFDAKTISDRIVIMLINEAADALYYKIATKEDIETSMTKGVNYPKGLLSWADEIGMKECVRRMDDLFNTYHDSRYRCSVLLRQMAEANQKFF